MRLSRRLCGQSLLTLSVLAVGCGSVHAAAKLPGFFTDNMVLQQGMPVPVWGTADKEEEVTVSFTEQVKVAKADENGRWEIRLDPLAASADGKDLCIKATNEIVFKNVVVGEVWICSGQSNMEFGVGGCLNAKEEAAAADLPAIRHMKIGHINAATPQTDVKSQWAVCSPATASGFTAVGFFFGRKLHQELQVPVGLISTNWGGTRIEPWICPAGFRMTPELKEIADKIDACDPSNPAGREAWGKALVAVRAWTEEAEKAMAGGRVIPEQPVLPALGASHQEPTKLYNGMIHPLIPYAIRGAIWYQGESNGGEGVSYLHKMRALINGWRALWKQGDFPFYYVQLANYQKPTDDPAGGDGWAQLREAQRVALTIPNTGMAVTTDIGAAGDIHPRNKQDVGMRLALWALCKTYGKADLVYSGPLYKSHAVDGNTIRIEFDSAGSGLMVGKKDGLAPTQAVADGALKRFAIAGEDKKWVWADAKIDGATVVVSSDKVEKPVAVRYAFSMNPEGCNLYNQEGLPASPFRTDSW